MIINITGRHFEVTEAIRQNVENNLKAIFEDKSLNITSATVVLDIEKNRCRTDVLVNFKNHEVAASAEGFDMYKSIEEAIGRIDAQLVKFLGKVQDHQASPLRDVTAPTEPMP